MKVFDIILSLFFTVACFASKEKHNDRKLRRERKDRAKNDSAVMPDLTVASASMLFEQKRIGESPVYQLKSLGGPKSIPLSQYKQLDSALKVLNLGETFHMKAEVDFLSDSLFRVSCTDCVVSEMRKIEAQGKGKDASVFATSGGYEDLTFKKPDDEAMVAEDNGVIKLKYEVEDGFTRVAAEDYLVFASIKIYQGYGYYGYPYRYGYGSSVAGYYGHHGYYGYPYRYGYRPYGRL